MISARVPAQGSLLLVAPVRGLTEEADRLLETLAAHGADALGLGLSPDELRGFDEYFVGAEAEPLVSLSPNELSEVRGLVRFGEVRVPNPTFVRALGWARTERLPVEALDPSDEDSASLFTRHVGYVELVRRTVRERRVARNPPTPSSPDEFALAWDGEIGRGRGSRGFASARDAHLAQGARRLVLSARRPAVVIDRERFESVRALLDGAAPEPDA